MIFIHCVNNIFPLPFRVVTLHKKGGFRLSCTKDTEKLYNSLRTPHLKSKMSGFADPDLYLLPKRDIPVLKEEISIHVPKNLSLKRTQASVILGETH